MKRIGIARGLLAVALCLVSGLAACEWSSGSDGSFNSSRAGLSVNISGFYRGNQSGGRAVSNKTGSPVQNFVILQNGNVIEVTDGNGQKYRGNVGAPGSVFSGTVIPAGTGIASFQVSWKGKDGTADQNIEFVGVINVVAVNEIRGTTTTRATGRSTATDRESTAASGSSTARGSSTASSASDSSSTSASTSTEQADGVDANQTVNVPGGGTAVEVFRDVTTTTTTEDSASDRSSSQASSAESASASSRDGSVTDTASVSDARLTEQIVTFELTEANSQFRLRGTWMEEGGRVSQVDALASGAGRLVGGTTQGVAGGGVAGQ